MSLRLLPHPRGADSRAFAVTAAAERPTHDRLRLLFRIEGPVDLLNAPGVALSARRDELWRTTCFEVFVAIPDTAYWEFNLSPSTAWAAYEFTDFRTGMQDLQLPTPPIVACTRGRDWLELTAEIGLPASAPDVVRLGLTAILEHAPERGHSFWALRHPDPDPNFHARDGFVFPLPA